MIDRLTRQQGFTLIELVMTIVLAGVLAAVAIRQMSTSIDTAKYDQTMKEMEQLGYAIVGDAALQSNGLRTDFGYVGDVGALPGNLDALVANPGSYSTWNGPYVSTGFADDDFKQDAWGVEYTYSGTSLRSTGSGEDIDYDFALSSNELLDNTVSGYVVDANNTVPDAEYQDSLTVLIEYANGSGGMTSSSQHPDPDGSFSFTGIPIGTHTIRLIYTPASDTVTHLIAVNPRRDIKLSIVFPADLW